jgi:hypothetical protein
MNKEYFTDNLSIETIAEITDEILRFEKNNKTEKIKINLFKIIPVAAVFFLIIGLVNLIPMFSWIGTDGFTPGSSAGQPPNINRYGSYYIYGENGDIYYLSGYEFTGSAEVSTFEELAQARKDGIKTIYVNGIIDIDIKYCFQIEAGQEIYIMPGAELNIHDMNCHVRGDIINNGVINVYGRMMLWKDPIEFGEINSMGTGEWLSGEIIYYCGYMTVAEMNRILNGDLPYTGITFVPFMFEAGKNEFKVVSEDERQIFNIDEDYTLPNGKSLWLNGQTILKVAENVTFTVNGSLGTFNKPIIEGEMIFNKDTQSDNDDNTMGKGAYSNIEDYYDFSEYEQDNGGE